ncbi:uncharacterized protein LOC111537956 [Piliocolobus tephrosceles]|uniref:uncharacterized protein LOC111537956 n=1 Tax=Piliocolobus tephrosceles TaxID=591936 RepID=UPI000C2A222E|nr:uncharacterized protein LOC111537956 [Piliocolobus tephrosceles]
MTPARQLCQPYPLSQRSGRALSLTATHRNRFPTSSGRVSTAIAVAAEATAPEATAASSSAREPVKPRSYRPLMLRRVDLGTAAAPNERRLGAHWPFCPGHSDLGPSPKHASGIPDSQRWAAAPHKKTERKPNTAVEDPEAAQPPPPRRGQYCFVSLPGQRRRAARLLPPARAGQEPREGRRNHRRRKVVPSLAEAAAATGSSEIQKWRRETKK